MYGLVLRNSVFDRTRNELLDLLRRRAWPRTTGNTNSYGDVGVFALRHGLVAEPAPNQNAGQQHPRNLPVFHEKSRNVSRLLDSLRMHPAGQSLVYARLRLGKRSPFL